MDELAELKRKLKQREGKPGYGPTAEAIKARIAALEAANAG